VQRYRLVANEREAIMTGYLSDVRFVVHGLPNQLQAWRTKLKEKHLPLWLELDPFRAEGEQRVSGEEIYGTIWTLRDADWSNMLAGKQEKLIEILRDAEKSYRLSFEYIRIGEDEHDVQHLHGGPRFMGILRVKRIITTAWEAGA
jgi:hypothetical protein